ncbi:hypothetical protein CFN78_26650 [Amycolatopsis antarctica]|uniref:Uncharacterized protein n=2 Tax=Amycolatopsis antarctica TaxID=1854586 RepID=A0A263CVK3_9PSEU|nr:hypothetical protein CFN78_26650 [Amycolatopsis antarctica]
MPATDTTQPVTEPTSLDGCTACSHVRDDHDQIGLRFCSATLAGNLARGCVCPASARLRADIEEDGTTS